MGIDKTRHDEMIREMLTPGHIETIALRLLRVHTEFDGSPRHDKNPVLQVFDIPSLFIRQIQKMQDTAAQGQIGHQLPR